MEMKDRIQQKANDLFRRYGVKSITMDEIATQLGVSKKTLYQYYSDKDELVESVVSHVIAYAEHVCNGGVMQSRDAIHELFLAVDFINDLFTDMNPAMMYDLERFHPRSYQLFLDYKNKFLHQVVTANLKRGIAEGLYRSDINIDILVKFRIEGMMLAFNPEIFPPSKYNLAETHEVIIEHFLFGVASVKGHQLILKYLQERTKS